MWFLQLLLKIYICNFQWRFLRYTYVHLVYTWFCPSVCRSYFKRHLFYISLCPFVHSIIVLRYLQILSSLFHWSLLNFIQVRNNFMYCTNKYTQFCQGKNLSVDFKLFTMIPVAIRYYIEINITSKSERWSNL